MLTLADYKSLQLNWVLGAISTTLVFHEYFLTIVPEIERFWPKRLRNFFISEDCSDNHGPESRKDNNFTLASFLFFLNRYFTVAAHIPIVVRLFFTGNVETCHHLLTYHEWVILMIQISVACIMVIRIYALYERQAWVAALYLVVCLSIIGLAVWAVILDKPSDTIVIPRNFGCVAGLDKHQAQHFITVYIGELIFDILVFGMTLYKTLTLPRGAGIGLLSQIVRDGTMYFGIMVAVNVSNIICLMLARPLSRGVVTTTMSVISSLAVSRLMLNLRNPDLQFNGQQRFQETTINDLGFQRRYHNSWPGTGGIMTMGSRESRLEGPSNSPGSGA